MRFILIIQLILTLCTKVCSAQTTYKYDAANRLTQVNYTCGGIVYTYDKNGNRKSETPVTIDVNDIKADETCSKLGSITLTPFNQNAQYSYQWNTGQITQSLSNLKAGLYSVVITDKPTGITCRKEFAIGSAFRDSIAVVPTNIICNGASNGKVKIKIVTPNPQGVYLYKWSTATDTTYRPLDSLQNLKPGNYSVSIRNTKNGCLKTVDFLITEPPVFVNGVSKTDATCDTKTDGIAKVEVLGDPNNYTYKWTGAFTGEKTTQQVNNLGVGNYTVVITEKSTLCVITKTLTIAPILKNLLVTPSGATTFYKGKSVLLSAPIGVGYTYSWAKNSITIPNATTSTLLVQESGSYTVTVAFNGCSVISLPIIVTVLDIDNFSIKATSETCRTSNNGSIKITAKYPMNYTVQLTPSNGILSKFRNEIELKNLSAGKYSVCISVEGQADFKQCFEVVITEPKDLAVFSSVNNHEKLLTLTLTGGSSYTIEQNGKQFTTTKSTFTLPLLEGSNNVKVTTNNLCQGVFEETFTLSKYIIIYPNPFDRKITIGLGDKKAVNIKVIIRDVIGNSVYSQTFNNGQGAINLELPDISAGIYTLQLTIGSTQTIHKIIKK